MLQEPPTSPTASPGQIASQTHPLDRTGLDGEEQPPRTSNEDTTRQKQPNGLSPSATMQTLPTLPTRQTSTHSIQTRSIKPQETNTTTNPTPPSQPPQADSPTPTPPQSGITTTTTTTTTTILATATSTTTTTSQTAKPLSLRTTLSLIARAFTSYITFKTKHARRIRRCKSNNASNLRDLAALSHRLDPYVERQRQGLLSAAEDAEVTRLVGQLNEMVEMVEMQIDMTEEMQRTLAGVGVLGFCEEARRRGR
ncbi:hypothetical protein MBLNU13_g07244t1 [Cladosporium sp. NU13]